MAFRKDLTRLNCTERTEKVQTEVLEVRKRTINMNNKICVESDKGKCELVDKS
jgi:hypothetical protein